MSNNNLKQLLLLALPFHNNTGDITNDNITRYNDNDCCLLLDLRNTTTTTKQQHVVGMSPLQLQQLVPIHFSLLSSYYCNNNYVRTSLSSTLPSTSTSTTLTLDNVLVTYLNNNNNDNNDNNNELELGRCIVRNGTSVQRLLVYQYIMYCVVQNENNNDNNNDDNNDTTTNNRSLLNFMVVPLKLLTMVIIPYLRYIVAIVASDTDTDTSTQQRQRQQQQQQEELLVLECLLDAIFCYPNVTSDDYATTTCRNTTTTTRNDKDDDDKNDEMSSSTTRTTTNELSLSNLRSMCNDVLNLSLSYENENNNDVPKTLTIITMQCRVLVRLYQYLCWYNDNNHNNTMHPQNNDNDNDNEHDLLLGVKDDVRNVMNELTLRGIRTCFAMTTDDGRSRSRRVRGMTTTTSNDDDDDDNSYLVMLHPIVTWLVPVLFHNNNNNNTITLRNEQQRQCQRRRIDELLSVLFRSSSSSDNNKNGSQQQQDDRHVLQYDNNNNTNPRMIVVTSIILCNVLPTVLLQKEEATTTTTTALLVPISNLVLYSLRRGIKTGGQHDAKEEDGTVTSIAFHNNNNDNDNNNNSSFPTSNVVPNNNNNSSSSTDQMLRRRGLYLLRLLVDHVSNNNNDNNRIKQRQQGQQEDDVIVIWQKYVLCVEVLEMETEVHLVDQLWDTIADICSVTTVVGQNLPSSSSYNDDTDDNNSNLLPSVVTWEWTSAMLARVFLSETPAVRKLGLYRFLSGHAGIDVVNVSNKNKKDTVTTTTTMASILQPSQKKKHPIQSKRKKQRGTSSFAAASAASASIDIVSTDFVLNVLIPSFDTLGQSIGMNMQFEEDGRIQTQDVTSLMSNFLGVYVSSLTTVRRRDFLRGLFGRSTVCNLRLKTTVMAYEAVAGVGKDSDLPIDQELLEIIVQSFGALFSGLLTALATMLSSSSSTDAVNPEVLLKIIALYPIATNSQESDTDDDGSNLLVGGPKYVSLRAWLSRLGNSPSWAPSVGAACASSFVMGQLFPPTSDWTPEYRTSETECVMGGAIVLLCVLAASSGQVNASELLWPAIHKGLTTVPRGYPWHNASRTCRSLLLLENGCRLGVTSGIGNGDLVMDRRQSMMPPPPNIERLLSNAVEFDLLHIEQLASFKGETGASKWGGARSGNATRVSATFANSISQMQVLCKAFPSSPSVSNGGDKMLKRSMEELRKKDLSAIGKVQNMALAFGALSCGADPKGAPSTVDSCRVVLHLEFLGNIDGTVSNVQTARSVFQYAKWGTMSYLLQALLESTSSSEDGRLVLLNDLFETAEDAVHATPTDALLPLFDCVVSGARNWLSAEKDGDCNDDTLYTENLARIVSALFGITSEAVSGRPFIYMLNELCALLFRTDLLMEEYGRLLRQGEDTPMPIRDAFRRLMEMAGTKRNHISKIAVSYVSMAWLGTSADDRKPSSTSAGLAAIPYRRDICDLLLHKEERLDESTSIQESDIVLQTHDLSSIADETSVSRGFVLTFLSGLPDVNNGLPQATLSELLHFIILDLLDNVCLVTRKAGALPVGTPEYSRKMRAWQALCVLSRYVTNDIADVVCDKVFACMGQNLHGQIRYFIEGFTIQCARRHPAIFGRKLVEEIRRTDLSLQNVTTLMITSGNLIVGRYSHEFFQQFDSSATSVVDVREILAGVIPWLSSTQGFSRAIAQLLVHKLIPSVININGDSDSHTTTGSQDSDWFLRSIYKFLDENSEMKRLRKKQAKFFDTYDVDDMCSVESLLQLEVDEGFEAAPEHMVDAIKKCLEQVYLEAHEHETPQWKQVAQLMTRNDDGEGTSLQDDVPDNVEETLVNFQRKIIPLDSLELNLAASRDLRFKNALGRRKQQLVVCASLVDKVPNLAGLARTCEIFAVQRLVIPDTNVCRMDIFKSVSVTADEWIDIEGCKEDNLLPWLRQQKERGYTIVGLEQTVSSMPLSDHVFTDKTVLLLGKEKEGIPVEFLQVVDVCIEIPQLGVIRSLNVHVSGALAIWEYTKQRMTATEQATNKLVS